MEAPEVPTEHLHEQLEHSAEHARERWITGVALSSAIIAALAAVASLLAGANANEAMILQMKASDQWNYYQAKGVKMNVLNSKIDLLTALGKTPNPKDRAKAKEYKDEQQKISDDANREQAESKEHLENHETMAKAVTVFQVAIAVGAVAALTRRRSFWYVSLLAAVFGAYVFGGGLIGYSHMLAEEKKHAAEEGAEGESAAAASTPRPARERPPASTKRRPGTRKSRSRRRRMSPRLQLRAGARHARGGRRAAAPRSLLPPSPRRRSSPRPAPTAPEASAHVYRPRRRNRGGPRASSAPRSAAGSRSPRGSPLPGRRETASRSMAAASPRSRSAADGSCSISWRKPFAAPVSAPFAPARR